MAKEETMAAALAHRKREAAWATLYSHHRLTVVEWGRLAETLDDLITELTGIHPEP